MTYTIVSDIFDMNMSSRRLIDKMYFENNEDGSKSLEYKYSDFKGYEEFYSKIKDKLTTQAKLENNNDKKTVRITDKTENIHSLIKLLYDK
ncbi:MAG: hypothetical protein A2452_04780 [Candidatus Firestonebacteria bacterium RIFOXYC2_FULL_39_67]|nr:MAG: hypothetical protein A2536_11315 [Candidatus Firestonebacteria bacterium RIFOXYD2_FULL_39_29]OGF53257.1 MAG: hypothetical protein A2497_02680 [Candidatus Firestonebacteria bacterium RifOxyC12_full_39_7]OGF55793.1 MAG: hypothetical protein A2452_04780 [Candidatus Firestonebacteria bacterium RIFOXYC2_FULL_39_67]